MEKIRVLAILLMAIVILIQVPQVSTTTEGEVYTTEIKYTYAGIYDNQILIRAEASLMAGGGETTGGERNMNSFVFSGQKWWKEDLPVSYRIDSAGDGTDPANAFVSIDAGAQTWVDDYASDWNVTYAGTSSGVTTPSNDGNNNIRFVSKDGPGGNLATTFWWFNLPSGRIIEFDMTFDDDETWVDGTPGPGQVDLESVALHEFGHILSLAHDTNPEAVMYAYYQGVDRDLYYTDIMGIRYIYPGPGIPYPGQTRVQDPWYPVYIMLGDIKAELMEETDDIDSALADIEAKLDPGGSFYTFVDTSFTAVETLITTETNQIDSALADIDSDVADIEAKLDPGGSFYNFIVQKFTDLTNFIVQKFTDLTNLIIAETDEIDQALADIEYKLDYKIKKETVEVEIVPEVDMTTNPKYINFFVFTTLAGERADYDVITVFVSDTDITSDVGITKIIDGVHLVEIPVKGVYKPGAYPVTVDIVIIGAEETYYGSAISKFAFGSEK